MQKLDSGNAAQLDTSKGLAAFLNVSEAAIRKWVWQRKIPVIRVGRCVRFDRGAVLEALQQRKPEPTATVQQLMLTCPAEWREKYGLAPGAATGEAEPAPPGEKPGSPTA